MRPLPRGLRPSGSQGGAPADSAPPAGPAVVGALENPGGASFQSGIGVISGWVCAAATVEIEITTEGGEVGRHVASYGTGRGDTQDVCVGHQQRLWVALQLESAGRWGAYDRGLRRRRRVRPGHGDRDDLGSRIRARRRGRVSGAGLPAARGRRSRWRGRRPVRTL